MIFLLTREYSLVQAQHFANILGLQHILKGCEPVLATTNLSCFICLISSAFAVFQHSTVLTVHARHC